MKAPFPWFGGKSRAAPIIWERFGDVPNFVEPFAGSLAVLLGRQSAPGTETVNDLDCYLANFWRSVAMDASGVAAHCDWPVNEADIEARHQWLVNQVEFRARMTADPDWFDAKIAGWWVWGLSAWIGCGWCRTDGNTSKQLPSLGNAGRGVHRHGAKSFEQLQARLRRVRVACGEWDRVLTASVTVKHGLTGVMLDPPYPDGEHGIKYSAGVDVYGQVRDWAKANGDDPLLRIALCGYAGDYAMPDNWECVAWKTKGGYGSQSEGQARDNSKRERIWFSPHCLKPDLFFRSETETEN